jgi:hypothetical protein
VAQFDRASAAASGRIIFRVFITTIPYNLLLAGKPVHAILNNGGRSRTLPDLFPLSFPFQDFKPLLVS